MEFEWDENKNRENIKKHGISFEEATTIFERPVWTRINDRYNYGEIREVSIGDIGNFVIVVVAHTERNNKTRIISARKAK
ncbi:BrnT family toxin [Candidatus Poribacteria bacterium]|nr:BrnT family toxin [Candidatus Poribacteria bacterium]